MTVRCLACEAMGVPANSQLSDDFEFIAEFNPDHCAIHGMLVTQPASALGRVSLSNDDALQTVATNQPLGFQAWLFLWHLTGRELSDHEASSPFPVADRSQIAGE
jgi:hypothetical protein